MLVCSFHVWFAKSRLASFIKSKVLAFWFCVGHWFVISAWLVLVPIKGCCKIIHSFPQMVCSLGIAVKQKWVPKYS